jgi:Na+/H+ antiporter NhaC
MRASESRKPTSGHKAESTNETEDLNSRIKRARKHPIVYVPYILIIVFVSMGTFVSTLREAKGNAEWTWDTVVNIGVFCGDSYD